MALAFINPRVSATFVFLTSILLCGSAYSAYIGDYPTPFLDAGASEGTYGEADAAIETAANDGFTQTEPFAQSLTSDVEFPRFKRSASISRVRRGFSGIPFDGQESQFGGGGFPAWMHVPGQSSGTAIGTASALQGRSGSSGSTFTSERNSNSLATAFGEGLNPTSTSIASSQSSGGYRRRREVTTMNSVFLSPTIVVPPSGTVAIFAGQTATKDGTNMAAAKSNFSTFGTNLGSTVVISSSSSA